MSDAAAPLYELLLALFQDETELRRFLAVVGLEDVEHRLPARKGESLRTLALDVSRILEEQGLVNYALLTALAQRSPSRSADVWAAGATYGVRQAGDVGDSVTVEIGSDVAPAGGIVTAGAEPDDEYADFARELEAELSAAGPLDTVAAALEPEQWPWTAAAAVMGAFRPTSLRPLSSAPAPKKPAVTALSAAVYTTFDGRWALVDTVRTPALARLHDQHALEAAVEANAEEPDAVRDWLRRLLAGDRPRLALLDSNELNALDEAARWLDPLGLGSQVGRAALYAAIQRRRLIDPLRALVGTHFRGRAKELADVQRHISGQNPTSLMVLRGPGGVGKSTLVGKVLLDLEERVGERPLPFAYVDFDKRYNDPNDPRALLEQIARQLRLLFAASSEGGRDLANVEAVISGTDLDYVAEYLNLEAEFDRLDLDRLVAVLTDRLGSLTSAGDDGPSTQLLLVLDTFEEVQMQGPGAVDAVLGLVRRLLEALPSTRVIVSGRGQVADVKGQLGATFAVTEVVLGDLDEVAALELLGRLGVADPAIRTLVVERFGGNPLTLRLAAEALRRVGSAEGAFDDVLTRTDVLTEVAIEQVQGVLYSRILGHIRDPQIVSIAHPGLAVRRVDVDVIRKVLAVPCRIDPADAESVFGRLRREVSLFELDDDGSLRHRQDVRRLMLRAMVDAPRFRPQVEDIHRRAVAYYAGKQGAVAQAEELYHRLMSDEDPRRLISLWDPELRRSLASALEEPLPPRARQWLERRLGRDDGDDRDLWDQAEWELSAMDRAQSWLASGQPAQALEVLGERVGRAPASPLYVLEVMALLTMGRLEDGRHALDRALASAVDAGDRSLQLSLAELAVQLAAARKDAAAVVAATRTVVRLADVMGDALRAVQALCRSTVELKELGATAEEEAMASELARRFGQLPAETLRDHADVVREVLQAVGRTESTVVARAATEVGDALRDDVFRDDTFALTRLLDQTSDQGRPQLDRLAAEVGLTGSSWSTTDLARSLARSGRVGQGVLIGLDFATDEPAARNLVVSQLVHPTNLTRGK